MNCLTKLMVPLSALFLLYAGNASAERVWIGSDGNPVRSGTGECVRAMYGVDHPECGGTMKRAPVVADSDGDGVLDSGDQCPDTPAGSEVDGRGCTVMAEVDSDGDGVLDSSDRCPGTAAGVAVDARGCALPVDSDGDGVVDASDRCPGTIAGAEVDSSGCTRKLVLNTLTFETNSAVLTGEAKGILNQVATSLKGNPAVNTVTIVGHTDSSGAASYNKQLSERRANSVRDYLVEQGIDGSKLTARGEGEAQPIADNTTRDGRMQNRRVEFTVNQ